jgi:mannose-6-phosphate isomerase-like protein (cupin superfamily)
MSAPGYTPSPRPTFAGPAHIPYAAATRHLWGDAESGEVADWIYVSSDKIHQLVFGVPPGGAFRHSEEYRTIFGADELLYVLSGEMVIANPEIGEVHRVRAGQSVVFGPDTWHHAFSYGSEPLRVLELFAPPPSKGTSGAYARTKPYLHTSRYTQDQWLGRWPMERAEARRTDSIRVVRDDDILWRLEGRDRQVLIGLFLATAQLTAGIVRLLPGQHSDVRVHGGDLSLYTPAGGLHLRLPEHEGQRWFELGGRDGFYIPHGVPYQFYNVVDYPTEALFGVAPHYLPE